jgi:multidrug transporter EmrE-like cation transporter
MKKAGIGPVVAGKRRPHKPGKFGFVHAVQYVVFRDFVAAAALLRRAAKFVQGRGDVDQVYEALDLAVATDGILTAEAISRKDKRRFEAPKRSLHVVCAPSAVDRHLLPGGFSMSLFGFAQLALSTVIFLLAATVAKSWAVAPGMGKLVLTLLLYSAGNLVMLRLVREFGMASAFSLSAVIQLVAVNVIALSWFGERLSVMQGSGIALAILAVGLITFGPALGR